MPANIYFDDTYLIDNTCATYSVYNLSYPDSCTSQDCSLFSLVLKPSAYIIKLWGASGGTLAGREEYGGRGAYIEFEIIVRQRINLYASVGSKGTLGSSNVYGGGGGTKSTATCTGGGAADIRIDKTIEGRIAVAGAGGGGTIYGSTPASGGNAGITTGSPGSSSGAGSVKLAQGGGQSLSNNQGVGYTDADRLATRGELGIGGTGGFGVSQGSSGGGSGYYGGGGGATNGSVVGSGAGGSSLIPTQSKMPEEIELIRAFGYGGDEVMPSPNGSYEIGHFGNAHILVISKSMCFGTPKSQMKFMGVAMALFGAIT